MCLNANWDACHFCHFSSILSNYCENVFTILLTPLSYLDHWWAWSELWQEAEHPGVPGLPGGGGGGGAAGEGARSNAHREGQEGLGETQRVSQLWLTVIIVLSNFIVKMKYLLFNY